MSHSNAQSGYTGGGGAAAAAAAPTNHISNSVVGTTDAYNNSDNVLVIKTVQIEFISIDSMML